MAYLVRKGTGGDISADISNSARGSESPILLQPRPNLLDTVCDKADAVNKRR